MDFEDRVQQFFYSALSGLGYDVSQTPGDASQTTWITFNEISGLGKTASNGAVRLRHLVQVHAWTHSEDDEHRVAFFSALAALREHGVHVFSYGPDQFESDTGIRHIACTCEWWQRD